MGVQISLLDKNPFIIRDQNGEDEKPATKVWVSNVPISCEDKQIETAMIKIGCELRSALKKKKRISEKQGWTINKLGNGAALRSDNHTENPTTKGFQNWHFQCRNLPQRTNRLERGSEEMY